MFANSSFHLNLRLDRRPLACGESIINSNKKQNTINITLNDIQMRQHNELRKFQQSSVSIWKKNIWDIQRSQDLIFSIIFYLIIRCIQNATNFFDFGERRRKINEEFFVEWGLSCDAYAGCCLLFLISQASPRPFHLNSHSTAVMISELNMVINYNDKMDIKQLWTKKVPELDMKAKKWVMLTTPGTCQVIKRMTN